MSITPKTKRKFLDIERLIKEGKTNSEIVKFLANKYGCVERTQYKAIKSYLTGKPTTYFSQKGKIEKVSISPKIINEQECYFCNTKQKVIRHHISYNPEIMIYLCRNCHSKIHIVLDEYHKIIVEKDGIISQYLNLYNQFQNIINLSPLTNNQK